MCEAAMQETVGSETPPGWTCFHCGEHFPNTREGIRDARDHFGTDTDADPACIMRLDGGEKAFLRALCDMQRELSRYQDEDSDVMRHLSKKTGEHARQLELAEETGYARGLRDARFAEAQNALKAARPIIEQLIVKEYNIETWGLRQRLAAIDAALGDDPKHVVDGEDA